MYEEFLERNLTFEDRVDAFTSCILTPDTKALALWVMDDKSYTKNRLYTAAKRFAGGDFPITQKALWSYCNGSGHSEGSLFSIGAVVKEQLLDTGSGSVIAYRKTDAGRDFGEPLAALACMLANELADKVHYASMLRLLGQASKPKTSSHRHGYAVYRIIKLLAENPESDFRRADIAEQAELGNTVASDTLNSLGKAGIIHYYSPSRDIGGIRQSGWSGAVVDNCISNADFETVYRTAFEERRFHDRGYLLSALDYCKQRAGEEVTRIDIAKACGMCVDSASACISILRDAGYLKGRLKGMEKQSSAKCTEHVIAVWNGLVKDVERLAHDVKPYKKLGRALDAYRDENLRLAHVPRWMGVYEQERTRFGPGHVELIGHHVLEELKSGETKSSAIHDALAGRGINISRSNMSNILAALGHARKVRRTKRGYYELV